MSSRKSPQSRKSPAIAPRKSSPGAGSQADRPEKLPGVFKEFITRFPELDEAHEAVARAVAVAGPLDDKTCELVKIGLSIGAGLESAVRAHVRKATQAGASKQEIEQAILLAMNTLGFPRTVAAWSWAQVQFQRDEQDA